MTGKQWVIRASGERVTGEAGEGWVTRTLESGEG